MNRSKTTAQITALVALRDIVCHPLRIQSLICLTERKASVAELAEDFGADKGTIAYHVKKLLEAGAIEIVDSRKGRGPAEQIYRAVQRPLMDDAESAELPEDQRNEWLERIFALIVADTTAALQANTFGDRPEHNLIRFPTSVDEQGWQDLTAVYAEALDRAMDIEAQSAARITDPDQAIKVRAVSMVFEMP